MCDFFPYFSDEFNLEFDEKVTKWKASSRLPFYGMHITYMDNGEIIEDVFKAWFKRRNLNAPNQIAELSECKMRIQSNIRLFQFHCRS